MRYSRQMRRKNRDGSRRFAAARRSNSRGSRRVNPDNSRSLLASLARMAMIERGLEPSFPDAAIRQAESTPGPASPDTLDDSEIRDLRGMDWASIDNDDSRDLDQLTVAEPLADGSTRIYVAIADVDALVKRGSPVDRHAQVNTTSVYTAGGIFPMLPERFSTDLTSLNDSQDRLSVVAAYVVGADGAATQSEVFRAWVRNRAKLAYNGVAAWLEGEAAPPPAMERQPRIQEQIRIQEEVAGRLKARRHERGALDLETIEPHEILSDGKIVDIKREEKNRAKELIEDFMIAANESVAKFLEAAGFATIRRIVRTPERWDRIVMLASQLGETLPKEADAVALEAFLVKRRRLDPIHFPDLSLAIVKMMGRGEYVVQLPGEASTGHFGLAVRDYTHSTAPNRRYPDAITQRMVKAAIRGRSAPYSNEDLSALALHCTAQEDAVHKVERQVRKSAAALLLRSRVGDTFDALVTGASVKGTWVRVLHPPVEGRVLEGWEGLDVGDRVTVRLESVNVERGFIDFIVVGN